MGHTTELDVLFSRGVLTARDDDVALAPPFEATVEEYESEVATIPRDGLVELLRSRTGAEADVEPFAELAERDPRTIAELCALYDQLAGTSTDWLPLLPVLRLFRRGTQSGDGVPGPFIPVAGDLLPQFADIYARLLVYVWLDDCPPCDALKDRLESIFDQPRGILLFAVYGPDHKAVLAEEYGVTAGPALLFVKDGAVDTRLYGDHAENVIENEVDRFLD